MRLHLFVGVDGTRIDGHVNMPTAAALVQPAAPANARARVAPVLRMCCKPAVCFVRKGERLHPSALRRTAPSGPGDAMPPVAPVPALRWLPLRWPGDAAAADGPGA